jgi:hypothetical protein
MEIFILLPIAVSLYTIKELGKIKSNEKRDM